MQIVLAKATLSSPQNLEGCATTKELRETTNKIRRISRLKSLKALERKDLQEEIKGLEGK